MALGWSDEVTAAVSDYLDHLFGQELCRSLEAHGEDLCDYNLFYGERAARSETEAYLSSFEVAARLYETIAPILDRCQAFICPTLATHEVRADAKPWETIQVEGHDVTTDFDWVLTHPFNMLSRLPVLAIPNGIASNGLPTGIQIVSRSFDDYRVFQLASAIERAAPWLDRDERRPMVS